MTGNAVGTHLIADFWGASSLTDVEVLDTAIRAAVSEAGATLLNLYLHRFGSGEGVTGVALLAESHISVHSWPERGYLALDVFMCGDCDPEVAVRVLEQRLRPARVSIRKLSRGVSQ
jgi:S-adenosylmethionine decarboxylase